MVNSKGAATQRINELNAKENFEYHHYLRQSVSYTIVTWVNATRSVYNTNTVYIHVHNLISDHCAHGCFPKIFVYMCATDLHPTLIPR